MEGSMSIEDFLYARDTYRVVSGPIKYPWPLHFVGAPEEDISKHKPEIQELLGQHGFKDEHTILMMNNVIKAGYPAHTPIPMLRIISLDDPSGLRTCMFREAMDGIKTYLEHNGLGHLTLEIAHKYMTLQPACFGIHPSHPAVRDFEAVEDQIVQFLNRNIRDEWIFLGLLLVRETVEEPLPTIVVLVNPLAIYNWLDLADNIYMMLWRQLGNNFQGIKVQILPGHVKLANPGIEIESERDAPSNGISLHRFITDAGKFRMGFSVGVKGEKSGGTAGGFVELVHNGVTRRGLLTNYSAVAPLDTVSAEVLEKIDKHGSILDGKDDSDDGDIEVEMFASADTAATKEYFESLIRDMENEHGDMKMHHDLDNETETTKYKSRAHRIRNCEVYIAKLRVNLEAIRQVASKPVGRVALSSGMLVHEEKIHDWAFVELFPEVADQIYHPNMVPHVGVSEDPANYGSNCYPELIHDIWEFGFMKEGDYYFKQGRTSETTSGICNGAKSHLNWQNRERRRYDIAGNDVDIDPLVTKEWVVWGQRAAPYQMLKQKSFSKPGDLGAFVVDGADGKVCGLLYGSVAGLCGPHADLLEYNIYAGLVMCMSDLMKSLELRAPGAVLSLPFDFSDATNP